MFLGKIKNLISSNQLKTEQLPTIRKPYIEKEILEMLQSQTQVEKQVIIHCCFPAAPMYGNLIRIWRTTFLIDEESGCKSQLIYADNISIFPFWTEVEPMKEHWFTLVFSGLSEDCKCFDLLEDIPQKGGFHVKKIKRNSTDVYRVKIS